MEHCNFVVAKVVPLGNVTVPAEGSTTEPFGTPYAQTEPASCADTTGKIESEAENAPEAAKSANTANRPTNPNLDILRCVILFRRLFALSSYRLIPDQSGENIYDKMIPSMFSFEKD